MNSILSVCTLVDSMKLSVTRVYVGSLMTSLQMAGVSLTLLKVLPDWEQLLGENYCCGTSLVYSSSAHADSGSLAKSSSLKLRAFNIFSRLSRSSHTHTDCALL